MAFNPSQNMINEVWKPLFGNEASYSVSNYGRVRSKDRYVAQRVRGYVEVQRFWKGKILKPKVDKHGYRVLDVKQHHTVLVSRMVAETFIDNPLDKPEVNHLNGFRTFNFVGNLEWATAKENAQHAVRELGRITKGGPGKVTEVYNDTHLYVFTYAMKAAEFLNSRKSGVHNAALREGTCKGFSIRYGI